MTWSETIASLKSALDELEDEVLRNVGSAVLKDFERALSEYKQENRGSDAQIAPTTAYVTWETVTVPAFLTSLRSFADEYDDLGTTPSGEPPNEELRRLKGRLNNAASAQHNIATRNLIARAASLSIPVRPRQYAHPDTKRDSVANRLNDIEAQALLWLELVDS